MTIHLKSNEFMGLKLLELTSISKLSLQEERHGNLMTLTLIDLTPATRLIVAGFLWKSARVGLGTTELVQSILGLAG